MTAPAISPTLRWFLSYGAAVVTGSVIMTLATLILTQDAAGGTGGLITAFLTRILPIAAFVLFLPVAILTAALRWTGLWHMGGFIGMGLAVPVIFIAGFLALLGPPADPPTARAYSAWLVVAGAMGGAAFGLTWNRTGGVRA